MKNNFESVQDFFDASVPKDVERFVSLNLALASEIAERLKAKGWTQKDLAKALGKKTSEVSKWLSGMHNLTLRSIAKLETALGEDLLVLKKRQADKTNQSPKDSLVFYLKPDDVCQPEGKFEKTDSRKVQLIETV